jgi:hypothetical protein
VGGSGNSDPQKNLLYEHICPPGFYINRYYGVVGPTGKPWIYALGPVQCSDGSNSTGLWGATYHNASGVVTQGNAFAVPTSGTLAAVCGFVDVLFDSLAVNILDFTACGGGLVGGQNLGILESAGLPSGDGGWCAWKV